MDIWATGIDFKENQHAVETPEKNLEQSVAVRGGGHGGQENEAEALVPQEAEGACVADSGRGVQAGCGHSACRPLTGTDVTVYCGALGTCSFAAFIRLSVLTLLAQSRPQPPGPFPLPPLHPLPPSEQPRPCVCFASLTSEGWDGRLQMSIATFPFWALDVGTEGQRVSGPGARTRPHFQDESETLLLGKCSRRPSFQGQSWAGSHRVSALQILPVLLKKREGKERTKRKLGIIPPVGRLRRRLKGAHPSLTGGRSSPLGRVAFVPWHGCASQTWEESRASILQRKKRNEIIVIGNVLPWLK